MMPSTGLFADFRDAFTTVLGPKFWKRVRVVVIAVIAFAMLRSCVGDWSEVPSSSMYPTILPGDRIVVNKIAYDFKLPFTMVHLLRWHAPQRGDIIVFFSPSNGLRLVKRVVAVPGDTIAMDNNCISINGQPASYTHDARFAVETAAGHPHRIATSPIASVRQSFLRVTLAPGKYFVLGDNRDDSIDSRIFGLVDRDLIIGRTSNVFFSLDPAGLLSPRWGRMLTNLD